ncbi:RNA-binding cell elongation regulator Jag/EloR [Candidatus Ruminimicrobiellum ovillum]|jgi:spoIIIJ-associated protein|uniref:RNA-binding cell elongation regulator Jag/EloR n=2 Tax=Candidatus Ruminimicrobiellum ovillum TaxID=1947927 RepID=UPI00355998B4
MQKELEFSGKNINDAIEKGLQELNCSKEDVEIKILDEGTKGLFGLMGSKPARVILTLKDKNGIKKENTKKEEPKREIDFDLACKNAKEYVSKIVSMMNIKIDDIKVNHDEDTVNIEVSTDSGSLLIGRSGQSLNALEYVVQLMLNTNPSTRAKVTIDTENYRQKQQERLKAIINKAIEYVKRTKKIYRFDPMSAKDRKFIHQYFKEIGGFDTFSEGEGAMRKVGVKLSIDKN